MLPHLTVSHVFGLGNVASDAVSRGYESTLLKLAAALNVRVTPRNPPKLALSLLEVAISEHELQTSRRSAKRPKLKHQHCWGTRGTRVGEASHPGPSYVPPRRRSRSDPRSRTLDTGLLSLTLTTGPTNARITKTEHSSTYRPPVRRGRALAGSARPKALFELPAEHPKQCTAATTPVASTSALSDPRQLAAALAEDKSAMAIFAGQPDALRQACQLALSTAASAFAARTENKDTSNWKAWREYCTQAGASPFRRTVDPLPDRVGYKRELVLLIGALHYFMKTRKPLRSADRAIQPQSAMNILLGVNRVLRRNFMSLIPLSGLKLALRGMMREFVRIHGPKSLIPTRREPFTNGLIDAMCTTPDGVTLSGMGAVTWTSLAGLSLKAAFTLAISGGFRKAELFATDAHTVWDYVSWFIQGKVVKHPTEAQLRGLTRSDFLIITPPPSKADQFNIVWGAMPCNMPFRPETRNAAGAIAALLLATGVEGVRENPHKPVFCNDKREPFKASTARTALFSWTSLYVPPEAAKLLTWHSGRIYLATALFAAGVKPSVIQTVMRWQTPESLRLYARMSRNTSAQMLDAAARAEIASVQTTSLPVYEQFDLFCAISAEVAGDDAVPQQQ